MGKRKKIKYLNLLKTEKEKNEFLFGKKFKDGFIMQDKKFTLIYRMLTFVVLGFFLSVNIAYASGTIDVEVIPIWVARLRELFGNLFVVNPNPARPGDTVTWSGGLDLSCVDWNRAGFCGYHINSMLAIATWKNPSGVAVDSVSKQVAVSNCDMSYWIHVSWQVPTNAQTGTWNTIITLSKPDNPFCIINSQTDTFQVIGIPPTTTTTAPPSSDCIWEGQQYQIGQSIENCESDNNVYRFVCTSDSFNPAGHWVKNPTTPLRVCSTTTTTTQPDFCKQFPQLCNLTSTQMFLLIIGIIVIVAGAYIYAKGGKK